MELKGLSKTNYEPSPHSSKAKRPADNFQTNVTTLMLNGVADAFLTRLDNAYSSSTDRLLGPWYLYGRPINNPGWNRNTRGKRSGVWSGLHLYTSPDLLHWTDEGRVLAVRDIPWKPATGEVPGLSHPAAFQAEGKTYLFFEADGEIGAAWAPSPQGPFTVRRTPIINQRKWGKASDPSVLGLPIKVDEFGQFHPAAPGASLARWLVWGDMSVTMCMLGKDHMELAFGLHRSRVIRWSPAKHGQAAQAVLSPQIIQLGSELFLLWIDENHRIQTACARHLQGPWKNNGPLIFAPNPKRNPKKTPEQTAICERISAVGSENAVPAQNSGSRIENSAPPARGILTVSTVTSTFFYHLEINRGGRLQAYAISIKA